MIITRCQSCGSHVTVPMPRNTQGRIAAIRAAWTRGATAVEIARRIGISKGAVLGYYHRHGASLKGYPLAGQVRAGTEQPALGMIIPAEKQETK